MRALWALTAAVAALGLSLAACDEPRIQAPAPATREATWARSFAVEACAAVNGCCVTRRLGAFDRAACEALVVGSLESAARLRGGGALREDSAAACRRKLAGFAATCVDAEDGLGFLDVSACDDLFTGGKAVGAACSVSAECANEAGGRAVCGGEPRRCEQLRGVAEGEACAGDCDGTGCDEVKGPAARLGYCDARRGLTCGADRRCGKRRQVGEGCDAKRACALDAFCEAGKCRPRGGLAAPCGGSDAACTDVTYCDAGSRTCLARKKNGEACSDPEDCASRDCAGRVCRGRTEATMLRVTADLRLFCASE